MFSWNNYLKLSKEWKDIDNSNPLSEAYYRSAISRAYYFAFHRSKDFAINNGFIEDPKRGGDRHREIISYLKNINKFDAGNYLEKLKKNRHTSDYDNDKNVDQRLVRTSLLFVTTTISDLERND
ncbi:hypothetical protein KAR28_04525 [Candidatus Parcubacteria bacterium]|nr:hypothetical protein [Candidatus Parcubacteria bacterium]